MPERVLPGLGLKGFDDYLANNWNEWTDENWRVVSVLLQGRAKSRAGLPGSPVNGDVYIVPAGASSHQNEIAIRDAGAWIYLVPTEGYSIYVIDEHLQLLFNGSAWDSVRFTDVVLKPGIGALKTPAVNGELTFEATSDTEVKIVLRGSDGTTRKGSIILA